MNLIYDLSFVEGIQLFIQREQPFVKVLLISKPTAVRPATVLFTTYYNAGWVHSNQTVFILQF